MEPPKKAYSTTISLRYEQRADLENLRTQRALITGYRPTLQRLFEEAVEALLAQSRGHQP
jgi:phosphoribosyl-ATP pyrophosphohydrolase